jgi:pyruvate/2-oxoglutarate dehydrogenase complex dihydrolipoamide acyltransferase (E2) component
MVIQAAIINVNFKEIQPKSALIQLLFVLGITMFNAIINPPQSLILACGGLQELVIADKNEAAG